MINRFESGPQNSRRRATGYQAVRAAWMNLLRSNTEPLFGDENAPQIGVRRVFEQGPGETLSVARYRPRYQAEMAALFDGMAEFRPIVTSAKPVGHIEFSKELPVVTMFGTLYLTTAKQVIARTDGELQGATNRSSIDVLACIEYADKFGAGQSWRNTVSALENADTEPRKYLVIDRSDQLKLATTLQGLVTGSI